MKTVITSSGNTIHSNFDRRFGRAAWFCLYDEESGQTEFIENDNKDAQGGAGTRTTEKMVELNVNKIISGDFGPKAKDLLNKLNIQMVIIQDNNDTIGEIISRIKK